MSAREILATCIRLFVLLMIIHLGIGVLNYAANERVGGLPLALFYWTCLVWGLFLWVLAVRIASFLLGRSSRPGLPETMRLAFCVIGAYKISVVIPSLVFLYLFIQSNGPGIVVVDGSRHSDLVPLFAPRIGLLLASVYFVFGAPGLWRVLPNRPSSRC